jgi:hypothetical protein
VIDFGDVIMVLCKCGSVTNSRDRWLRHDPHTVFETDTCGLPPIPEKRIVDLTPGVSHDGGKTWARVDERQVAERPKASCECGKDHPIGTLFFVTCIEDEGKRRTGFLLGPYDTHSEALTNVDRGRKLAEDADEKAHWYSFGTRSISEPTDRKGMLGK